MRSPGPAVRFQGKAKRNPVEHPGEYHDAMITVLELIWGKGFMTPGGEGNVANMIDGLDVRGKRILEIGSGLGGPAFVLAGKYGALVVGTDLEPHLVEHAQHRARELELDAQTEFLLVNRGSLEFADESFDIVLSGGAFTQTADKRSMFGECLRVLRPGGALTCYDWMKPEGEYSEDMLYWFKMEGLTYAMETPENHRQMMKDSGFIDIIVRDRSSWYRRKVQEEYEQVRSDQYPRMVDLLGKEQADHFVETWSALKVVCLKGEVLQVYCSARKPV
ncbi:MAG: methyltransferase domain-containing protein [Acidobacteriota bacterium]